MKKFNSRELLEQLETDTRQIILSANYLLNEDPGILTGQPEPGKWSVAQVIEHMNTYSRYYLPRIKQALQKPGKPPAAWFTAGWFGNYFTKIMLPQESKVKNKMKAFKNHRPSSHIDSKQAIDEFIAQQKLLLQLLDTAKQHNIGKLRIPISISKLIKLKLGDTFRFFIAHEQRHMVQVKNTLALLKNGNGAYTMAGA